MIQLNQKSKNRQTFQVFSEGLQNKNKINKSSSETASSSSSSSLRTLQAVTAEKWKTTKLAQYNADEWLEIVKEHSSGQVSTLKCSICKSNIEGIKGFNSQWVDDGCRRLIFSSAFDHANSEPHKKAYDLHMKVKGLNLLERNKITRNALTIKEKTFCLVSMI